MNPNSIRQIRSLSAILIQRLGEVRVAKSFQPHVDAFESADAALREVASEVEAAKARRGEAVRAIKAACVVVETSIDALAANVVLAKLGKHNKPFAALSSVTPSEVAKAAFANRSGLVRKLVADVRAKGKLPTPLDHAAGAALDAAEALDGALADSTPADLAYRKALRQRTPIAASWLVALQRLKNAAKVAWEDEPATYAAVFAPPEKVRVPHLVRKRVSAKAPEDPVASPTQVTRPALSIAS